ncbi:uncharacterized protein LAESUDRAFT_70511 [Laetiporus sulphureus 93-53]|uniref:Uncharacterized protein n=1 Tax=Laetiporus sulphureus 93-53 TaxID=1314785 RepID=A0A165AWP3_9APHY|nr:uncharacterized protein LAESUDRAFT_70511 [Laetiporus sulphureus 93-53]KZS99798.1 hypothetical protein LAESUDRAFT_70511 [Laetiporus sulphureus 93-53]
MCNESAPRSTNAVGPSLLPSPDAEDTPNEPDRNLQSRSQVFDRLVQDVQNGVEMSEPIAVMAASTFMKFMESYSEDLRELNTVRDLIEAAINVGQRPSVTQLELYLCWYRRTGERSYLDAAMTTGSQVRIELRMEVLYERYRREGAIALGRERHKPGNQPQGGILPFPPRYDP